MGRLNTVMVQLRSLMPSVSKEVKVSMTELDAIQHAASAAMDEAKTQGRNRCVIRPMREPPGHLHLVSS